MTALPRSIRRGLIVHYLFDDIFYKFRFFFNTQKNKDSKFLYDVAFGLKPRNFSQQKGESMIYDEDEEVLEMYFVISGEVAVGYVITKTHSTKMVTPLLYISLLIPFQEA